MGIFKPCYSIVGDSVEVAVIEMYEEAITRAASPGFDDVLGEPYLVDSDADGIGERVRSETTVEVTAKAKWSRHEEQEQDGTGNDPSSFLTLTLFRAQLLSLSPPLIVSGKILIRPNDRLLRLESQSGVVRADFEVDGREGLYVFEVRPGETGSGTIKVLLERRKSSG